MRAGAGAGGSGRSLQACAENQEGRPAAGERRGSRPLQAQSLRVFKCLVLWLSLLTAQASFSILAFKLIFRKIFSGEIKFLGRE